MASIIREEGVNYSELIEMIPSRPVPNHAFKNQGNLLFQKYVESGLLTTGFSNGSAYGDLDNDGDLDLVVNNVNMPPFIFENKSRQIFEDNHFLKFELQGEGMNTKAVGARIEIKIENEVTLYYDNQPARGFQSSMDNRINAGVGSAKVVDVRVTWPSLKVSELKSVPVNQTLRLSEEVAESYRKDQPKAKSFFNDISHILPYTHKENFYIDFNRERLNYHKLSTQGPSVAMGDLNGNGLNDWVIPGPKGQATSIFFQKADGTFFEQPVNADFEKLKEAEHVRCYLIDIDNDGDLDLYVASGGVELSEFSDYLYDRIFLNDGKGNMTLMDQVLPASGHRISTGAVAFADIDGDGSLDIFVGERVKTGRYGAPGSGYILMNDGKGNFSDETETRCPQLRELGMITDAYFADLNGNGTEELVVTGEFLSVNIFVNENGIFKKMSLGEDLNGWWNTMKIVDIDGDGDLDIILGNHGLNSRFKADESRPIILYFNDFDENGDPEGILSSVHENGKTYPYALRHNLMARLPGLKKQYPSFESFKEATMEDIFSYEILQQSHIYNAYEMQSMVLINEGDFKFSKKSLPLSAQISPIYAIGITDLNDDGLPDLILGGNLYGVQPEVGRYDASYGHILINDGTGNFEDKTYEYGFLIRGEVRDICLDGDRIFIFRNNEEAVCLKILK